MWVRKGALQNMKALNDFINEAEKSGNRNGEHAEIQAQIRNFMAQAQEYQGALDLASVPSYVEPCQEVDDSTSADLDAPSPDGAPSEAHVKAFSALRASGPNSRLMNAQALGRDVHDRCTTSLHSVHSPVTFCCTPAIVKHA